MRAHIVVSDCVFVIHVCVFLCAPWWLPLSLLSIECLFYVRNIFLIIRNVRVQRWTSTCAKTGPKLHKNVVGTLAMRDFSKLQVRRYWLLKYWSYKRKNHNTVQNIFSTYASKRRSKHLYSPNQAERNCRNPLKWYRSQFKANAPVWKGTMEWLINIRRQLSATHKQINVSKTKLHMEQFQNQFTFAARAHTPSSSSESLPHPQYQNLSR